MNGTLHQNDAMASMPNTGLIFPIFTIFFTICEILYRSCYLLIQLSEVRKILDVNLKTVLEEIYNCNTVPLIILIVSVSDVIISTIFENTSFSLTHISQSEIITYLLCISSVILLRVFICRRFTLDEILNPMRFTKGLDFGTGMAYNYYYGYLRIILPSTGMSNKGLREKIHNFEDTHNINFTVRRLFILIPSSSYIPPDLKEASYGWMECISNLEDEVRSRAGVMNRLYRNNVYKIYQDGEMYGSQLHYVVAEGATPMLTFFEVQKHLHLESNIYKKYRKYIVLMFYKKLKELLQNDPECKDICELVHYNDYTTDGNKVNVAKVILERISELKRVQLW